MFFLCPCVHLLKLHSPTPSLVSVFYVNREEKCLPFGKGQGRGWVGGGTHPHSEDQPPPLLTTGSSTESRGKAQSHVLVGSSQEVLGGSRIVGFSAAAEVTVSAAAACPQSPYILKMFHFTNF